MSAGVEQQNLGSSDAVVREQEREVHRISRVLRKDATNHRGVLGVSASAPIGTCRREYLRLARLLHPDRLQSTWGVAPERFGTAFQAVSAAHTALEAATAAASTAAPAHSVSTSDSAGVGVRTSASVCVGAVQEARGAPCRDPTCETGVRRAGAPRSRSTWKGDGDGPGTTSNAALVTKTAVSSAQRSQLAGAAVADPEAVVVVPSAQFKCRRCAWEGATRAEMATHFRSDEHLSVLKLQQLRLDNDASSDNHTPSGTQPARATATAKARMSGQVGPAARLGSSASADAATTGVDSSNKDGKMEQASQSFALVEHHAGSGKVDDAAVVEFTGRHGITAEELAKYGQFAGHSRNTGHHKNITNCPSKFSRGYHLVRHDKGIRQRANQRKRAMRRMERDGFCFSRKRAVATPVACNPTKVYFSAASTPATAGGDVSSDQRV